MTVFNLDAFDEHEQVVFCNDPDSGLRAIICVHNTALGPAVGGTRMWQYENDQDALIDALRLSRGMTYKNAMAGLNFGGGKAVIMGDAKTMKTDALFKSYGQFLESLSGKYITAEDVGITTADMGIVNSETKYVAGLEGKSGDPSPVTAFGVYRGIQAAVKHRLNSDTLDGLKIAVQGVGHVGYYLCKHLREDGAELVITDIDQQSIDRVVDEFSAKPVSPEDIYDQTMDIYAPCALGATINDSTLDRLSCKIVAGAANNQLAENRHGLELMKRGILYAPDYVINAGGIINISFEDDYSEEKALDKVSEIYDTLMEVFNQAKSENKTTNEVADSIARSRIEQARH